MKRKTLLRLIAGVLLVSLLLLGCAQPTNNVDPSLTISSHTNGQEVSGTITISGEASDDSAIVSVEISFDDGATFVAAVGTTAWSSVLDTVTKPDGNLFIQVRATDDAGSAVRGTLTLVVENVGAPPDSVGPVVTIVNPETNQFVSGTLTVIGIALDESAISAVQIKLDGGSFGPVSSPDKYWSHAISTQALSEGSHTITVNAQDSLGNIGSDVSVAFTVDQLVPIVGIDNPSHGDTVTGSITVDGTASDANGIDVVYLHANDVVPGTLALGTTSWDVDPYDTTLLPDGNNTLTALAYDMTGLTSVMNITVVVDNNGPSVAITSHSELDPVAGTITLEGTASDAVSLDRVEVSVNGGPHQLVQTTGSWSLDIDTTALPNPDAGAIPFQVTAYDDADNSTLATVTLIVDQSPPVVTIAAPVADSYHSGNTIGINGTATTIDDSDAVEINVDGGGPATVDTVGAAWSHTLDISGGDRLVDVTIKATDTVASGGTDAWGEQTVSFYVDNTDPAGSIDWPLTDSDVSGITLISGTADDAGAIAASAPITVVISDPDGAGPIATYDDVSAPAVSYANGSWSVTWDTGSVDGDRVGLSVELTIIDEAGNTYTESVTGLDVDAAAPSGNITYPANGEHVDDSITVQVDTSGTPVDDVTGVEVTDHLGAYQTAVETVPGTSDLWEYIIDTTAFPSDGLYEISARMNGATITKININVDNTDPTNVEILSPDGSETGDDHLFGVAPTNGTAFDANLDTVEVYYDAAPYGGGSGVGDTVLTTSGTTIWSGDWDTADAPIAEIDARLTATATDLAGNSTDFTVRVDVKPKITGIDVSSILVDSVTPPTLTITGYNFDSGLATFGVMFPLADATEFRQPYVDGATNYSAVVTATEIQVKVPYDDDGAPVDVVSGDVYVKVASIDSNAVHLDIWENHVGEIGEMAVNSNVAVFNDDLFRVYMKSFLDNAVKVAYSAGGTGRARVFRAQGSVYQPPSIAVDATYVYVSVVFPESNTLAVFRALNSLGIDGYDQDDWGGGNGVPVQTIAGATGAASLSATSFDASGTTVGIVFVNASGEISFVGSPDDNGDNGTWDELEVIEPGIVAGRYHDFAYDSNGNRYVVYYDQTNDRLRFAYNEGAGWQVSTIDSGTDMGLYASIDLGTLPGPGIHVSYMDGANGDLKYAYAADAGSLPFTVETVQSTGAVGTFSDIMLNSSDRPRISYMSAIDLTIRLASHNGTTWDLSEAPDSLFPVATVNPIPIAIDSSDYAYIAYSNGLDVQTLIYRR